jgi:hypothetical protein
MTDETSMAIIVKKDNQEISLEWRECYKKFWITGKDGDGMTVKEEIIFDLLDEFFENNI